MLRNKALLYVGLDDQPAAILTGFTSGAWRWANCNTSGGTVTIAVTEPGFHILHLWEREDGLRLDKIVLILLPAIILVEMVHRRAVILNRGY